MSNLCSPQTNKTIKLGIHISFLSSHIFVRQQKLVITKSGHPMLRVIKCREYSEKGGGARAFVTRPNYFDLKVLFSVVA